MTALRLVGPPEPLPPIGDRSRLDDAAAERRHQERLRAEPRRRRERAAAERLRAVERAVDGLDPVERAVLLPAVQARKPKPPEVPWRWVR